MIDLQGWTDYAPFYESVAKHCALDADPAVFVEVGVWKGAGVAALCEALIKAGRRDRSIVVAVDTWSETGHPDANSVENAWYRRLGDKDRTIWQTFRDNMKELGYWSMIRPLWMPSAAAARSWPESLAKPNLVFIDGDHSREAVLRDIEEWRKISPMLAGHDFAEQGVHLGLQDAGIWDDLTYIAVWNTWFWPVSALWQEAEEVCTCLSL